eukprot:199617_1
MCMHDRRLSQRLQPVEVAEATSGNITPGYAPVLPVSARRSSMDMDALSGLPGDHPLRQLQLDHTMSMTKMRYELESLEQAAKLEKIKTKKKILEDEELSKIKHDQWLEEQKRVMERTRVSQTIAKEKSILNQLTKTPGKEVVGDKYSIEEGFYVMFDYILGLKPHHKEIKMVYQILQGTTPKVEVSATPLKPTETDGPAEAQQKMCILAVKKRFAKVPVLNNLKIAIEVQHQIAPAKGPSEPAKMQGIGWTIIDLFFDDSGRSLSESFREGYWKLPLFRPPMNASADFRTMYDHRSAGEVVLYVRLLKFAKGKSTEAGGDPSLTQSLYIDQRNGKPLTKSDEESVQSSREVNIEEIRNLTRQLSVASGKTKELPPEIIRRVSMISSAVEGLKDTVEEKNKVVEEKNKEDLYDSVTGFGVLIQSAEHHSRFPYARVRVTIYSAGKVSKDELDNDFCWSTPQAQMGASGSLGVYEWERRNVFEDYPFQDDSLVVFELLESKEYIPDLQPNSPREKMEEVTACASFETFRFADDSEKHIVNTAHKVLQLYKPPMKFPLEKSDSLSHSQLSIVLFDPTSPPPERVVSLEPVAKDVEGGPPAVKLPWMRVDAKPPTEHFEPGDGFDIYVDGCRFLPDNVTISQATIHVFTESFDQKILSTSAVCSLDSSAFFPEFYLRTEMRGDKFLPTLTLVIRIDTLNQQTKSVLCHVLLFS